VHENITALAAIDSAGWIAIGTLVASIVTGLIGWFVLVRENWRDKVDAKMAKYDLKFQRIQDLAGIDLDVDE